MKFMFTLVALSCAVLTQCHPSYDDLPKHPGGIGGLFRGPNSETIIRGPDGSEITAAEEAGHVATGGELQTIVAAEPVLAAAPVAAALPVETAPALPILSETIETHTTIAAQPVLAEAAVAHAAIPVVDVTKPVDIKLIDAPDVEPTQNSDLHGSSGSIITRGSKSIVSGPASTTIHEPVRKIPLVAAAAVPVIAHSEIRPAILETASIQQAINIESAAPIVQPASLNGLIGNEISSTIAPALQVSQQPLLGNNIHLGNTIAITTAAPTASQISIDADRNRIAAETAIQQAEAEAIARSQQIAAANQRQRQQGEAEALLSSQLTAQAAVTAGPIQQPTLDSAAALEEQRRVAEQVAIQRNRQLAEEAAQIEAARQQAEAEASEKVRILSAQAAEVEQGRLAAEAEAQARIKALSEAAVAEDNRQRAEAEEIERRRQLLDIAAREDARRRDAEAQAYAQAQTQVQVDVHAQTQVSSVNNVGIPAAQGYRLTPGLSISTTIRNPDSENDLRLLEEQRRQQGLAQAQLKAQREQSLAHALNQGQIGLNPALIPANNIIPPGVGLVSSTIAPDVLADNSLRVDGRQVDINQIQLQNQIPLAPAGLDSRTLNAGDTILHSELTKLNIDPSQIQLSNVPLSQVQGLPNTQWGRYGRQLKKKKN